MVATTWNPSDKSSFVTLSNVNLTATAGSGLQGVRGIDPHTNGKYYWEYTATTWASSTALGMATSSQVLTNNPTTVTIYINFNGQFIINGSAVVTYGTRANGDLLCYAFDLGGRLAWTRIGAAGNWNNSGTANPATAAGGMSFSAAPLAGLAVYPYAFLSANTHAVTANFGGSAFTGAVPGGFTAGWPAGADVLSSAQARVMVLA